MTKISVTINEAVEISGISRSGLYKMFKAGKITPRKNGKRTLLLVADLERVIENLPAAA
ncbi:MULTISPECIES: helix-turn-helix domain-containing protein [unclassified Mesorhizobium]|uniref:helix-turn-helix domain-containing protein n=1 Tax=unclassified Mesorhizobium TaxID=325217 RepID=UPI0003D00DD3|nr:helix-turn-helix domain-containing protein [Mesorhizobium sp. L103C131B0]ESZ56518.1 regulatory protein [Mesorhizobium sp. L103C131B0]